MCAAHFDFGRSAFLGSCAIRFCSFVASDLFLVCLDVREELPCPMIGSASDSYAEPAADCLALCFSLFTQKLAAMILSLEELVRRRILWLEFCFFIAVIVSAMEPTGVGLFFGLDFAVCFVVFFRAAGCGFALSMSSV